MEDAQLVLPVLLLRQSLVLALEQQPAIRARVLEVAHAGLAISFDLESVIV